MSDPTADWPRQHYVHLRDLEPEARACALMRVPAHLRAWVALYLSMPEDRFAEMKTAARIARLKDKQARIAALNAIEDPEARRRIRACARDLFYRA